MKGKTHDLNHDLTFYAHTFNGVCHSIGSMFRVLGIYNFDCASDLNTQYNPYGYEIILLIEFVCECKFINMCVTM